MKITIKQKSNYKPPIHPSKIFDVLDEQGNKIGSVNSTRNLATSIGKVQIEIILSDECIKKQDEIKDVKD